MARTHLALPLILLLCVPAVAAPDAVADWKKAQKRVTKNAERPYWDEFDRRLGEVWAGWRSERSLWRGDPEFYRHEVPSLERVRDLYEDFIAVQMSRLTCDETLAASGDPKAAQALFDALIDVLGECADLDAEIAAGRPIAYFSLMYDQALAVKRHGFAARVDGLVEALAGTEGASAWLAEAGWAEAKKRDKKKSLARRSAVLDALGRAKDGPARARLELALAEPEPGVRIVALENLVPFGIDVLDLVRPLLADPAPAVRRALLETVARRGADEPRWIPLALEAYGGQAGLVRARALEALGALTGQVLPDDVERWKAWYAEHEKDIAAGSWQRPPPPEKKPAVGDAKDEEKKGGDEENGAQGAKADPPASKVRPAAVTTFYGVGAPSRFVIFAFDGSTDMDLPADLETQLSKSKTHWQQTGPKWRETMLDHRTVLLRQLDGAIAAMPADGRFATIHLWGTNLSKIPVMGDRKPLEPKKATRKKVAKAIGKARPQGQFSVEEATRLAFGLCGQDPFEEPDAKDVLLDTLFLVAPGWIGGRWGIPEAMVADFRRWNRYHRLQVNTIRITDRKEESVRLMKGLAEASGGTYHWLEKVPE